MRYTPAEMVQIAAAEPWTLHPGVVAAINAIYQVVGAETYSSSPIFPVKETKKKKPKSTLADFTANLNKLSEETFHVVAPLVFTSLDQMDDKTRDEAAEYLVHTASNNNFGVEWYSTIFAQAAKRWPVFYDKFSDHQEEYKEALNFGKENQRKFLNFAIHLSKIGAIGPMNVLAVKIQNMIEANAMNADRKAVIEEWTEHLALLVSHKVPVSLDKLQKVCEMRPATHTGITNKTLFKFMDMLDGADKV